MIKNNVICIFKELYSLKKCHRSDIERVNEAIEKQTFDFKSFLISVMRRQALVFKINDNTKCILLGRSNSNSRSSRMLDGIVSFMKSSISLNKKIKKHGESKSNNSYYYYEGVYYPNLE